MNNINLLYVDLFCGAGGTSTGVESARINGEQCAKIIACVNHDTNAIASHAANHPEAIFKREYKENRFTKQFQEADSMFKEQYKYKK